MRWQTPMLLPGDTVPSDVQADSIASHRRFALIVEADRREQVSERSGDDGSTSWILLGLFAMLAVICYRYRKNTRYFTAMLHDLTDVRVRNNVFDDTVRETSFLILLNVMWSLCAGVLLYSLMTIHGLTLPGGIPLPYLSYGGSQAVPMAVCMAIALAYSGFMTIAYSIVGNVFSDTVHTRMWVKGFASAQGLDVIALLPLSLLAVTMPTWRAELLAIAAGSYLLTKIIFIYKGFRIFFTQTSSWVLFLYYLCSLEIVPVIRIYLASLELCSLL